MNIMTNNTGYCLYTPVKASKWFRFYKFLLPLFSSQPLSHLALPLPLPMTMAGDGSLEPSYQDAMHQWGRDSQRRSPSSNLLIYPQSSAANCNGECTHHLLQLRAMLVLTIVTAYIASALAVVSAFGAVPRCGEKGSGEPSAAMVASI